MDLVTSQMGDRLEINHIRGDLYEGDITGRGHLALG